MTEAEQLSLAPLRDRVAAPAAVEHPVGPDGLEWRAATVGDAAGISALFEAMSRRDHPEWSETVEEVAESLGHSWIDLAHDSLLARAADGAVVAFGLVDQPLEAASVVRVFLVGGVRPDHRGRGIGRRLLQWQHDRARERLAATEHVLPAWVLAHVPERAPEQARLLERAGFATARYFTTLVADLHGIDLARPQPEGVDIERFRGARSEEIRAAKNAVFADHWGSQPQGEESWTSMISLPTFRPELSRIAVAGGEVVGFVLAEVNDEDWPRQGYSSSYLSLVGTTRAWRGRGLASALLAEVMRASREAGLERVVLDVDTENQTGALGVYSRLGFVATTRDAAYRVVY